MMEPLSTCSVVEPSDRARNLQIRQLFRRHAAELEEL